MPSDTCHSSKRRQVARLASKTATFGMTRLSLMTIRPQACIVLSLQSNPPSPKEGPLSTTRPCNSVERVRVQVLRFDQDIVKTRTNQDSVIKYGELLGDLQRCLILA
jgi:hypothetical protein